MDDVSLLRQQIDALREAQQQIQSTSKDATYALQQLLSGDGQVSDDGQVVGGVDSSAFVERQLALKKLKKIVNNKKKKKTRSRLHMKKKETLIFSGENFFFLDIVFCCCTI